ncbi:MULTISPECIES: Xaa-Pro peptidase family protein [unclassified Sphingopyxis]|uniref:M24 family metallopeptidase n=1 Tax=unclassified Sphingopyxis TaxID=2614943 RepID=UPI0007375311|nr:MULTISPECIES: Xaa-Pro peptidase family protein [unclassified Sphingopyxis]KTE25584.1 peptidase [Sphingopyxis sp. H057]KTE53813.1 peptidase [Sphingopyxis sp. H073]KTE56406.1 peptidase [Sphingopyxis sp. H071]KTE62052.1 peptidase [Sphingopyxis sp. H107]KTE67366.1 peptidase [Sphingopyxis sp. H100]
MQRRQFLGKAALTGLAATMPVSGFAADTAGLPNLAAKAVPIGKAERMARIARATELMRANDIGALLVEPGSSLIYFTGVEWWRSERLTAAVLTREGEVAIVTPFFEEPSVRESLGIEAEVLMWNEDENPLAAVAAWLGKRGLAKGRIGVEETVRYFAVDGLQRVMPGATVVNGAPVVRGCRMHKSAAEIALMQIAADITIAAYRHTAPRIEAGMTPADIGAIMKAATQALGGQSEFELILLGEASAYPHGSGKPQAVKDGEVVLMDCGATVHGYQSDISRTFVYGKANARQRQVWEQMRKGQDVAFAAAKLGTPAGAVDDAVRAYYQNLGWGPGYKLPGTSHRTGHGIGLDGHEPVNLVHGEMTKLAPGMCFSNEPGIYIPGEFGIRLEDCFYMTDNGPKWFSEPPPSIDRPFG